MFCYHDVEPGGTMRDTCLTLMESTEIITIDRGLTGTLLRDGQFYFLVPE